MALSGGYSKEIKIPANTLPLDANMQIMAKFEIGDGNFDIEVGEDTDYEALEMKVGSYINAEGKVVRDAADAGGFVFKMESIGSDVPANYPVALQGKTIAGYAVAIENVASVRQVLNNAAMSSLVTTDATVTNGTQATETLLTGIGEVAFMTTYNSWVNEHPLDGDSLSSWYIHTVDQLGEFMGMLFKIGEVEPTGVLAFREMPEFAFENGVMFDRDPIESVYYASCTVYGSKDISGVIINVDKTTKQVLDAKASSLKVTGSSQKALCRPMITIFK